MQLFAMPRKSQAGMPVWGKLVVYNSRKQAVKSLSTEEVEEQRVRLIQIADTQQLRRMLDVRNELCAPEAALYLEVADTCALYWTVWDNDKDKADMHIACDIPQSGTRSTMLEAVRGSGTGVGAITARCTSNDDGIGNYWNYTRKGPICVHGGHCVVGSKDFGVTDDFSSSSEEDEGDDHEEENEVEGPGEGDGNKGAKGAGVSCAGDAAVPGEDRCACLVGRTLLKQTANDSIPCPYRHIPLLTI